MDALIVQVRLVVSLFSLPARLYRLLNRIKGAKIEFLALDTDVRCVADFMGPLDFADALDTSRVSLVRFHTEELHLHPIFAQMSPVVASDVFARTLVQASA